MATPPKFMRFPFAATGDKEAIPDEAQASGNLSYSEGFGLDYERDPTKDAKAKRMPRGGTNQVLYDATSNIQQYQLYGVPYWYDAASNGGTAIQYQKNTMVRFAVGNSENIYISLKDNNTDIPTVSSSWFLFQPYNSTLLSRLSVAPFVPVESMTTTAPPANPTMGKAYLIPANATGFWTGKAGQLTEWDGKNWLFTITPNGHGIGLPDGRVFTKVDGSYIEKIALDSQSGKWNYAEAGGSANALTATLDPKPLSLTVGTVLQLKITTANMRATTLNLNGFGAKPIIYHETGEPLIGGDFQAGDVVNLVYDGTNWRLQPSLAFMDKRYSRLTAPPTDTYYVLPSGNDNNTGFAATAQAGFKTISGAINAIASRYSTNMQIKLIVSPGTYGGFTIPTSFINSWSIISSTKKATDVIVDASSLSSNAGRAANIVSGTINLSYMTFKAYYECIGISTSQVSANISNVNLELAGTSSVGISSIGGIAYVTGDIQLLGTTGLSAFRAANGGYIRLGYNDAVASQAASINFASGALRLADANVIATQSGTVEIYSSVFYGNGYPAAKKYTARLNGIINTFGGGIGFLPGNTAGTTESGGQYV